MVILWFNHVVVTTFSFSFSFFLFHKNAIDSDSYVCSRAWQMPARSLKASYTSDRVSCRCTLVDVSYRHEPINPSWLEIISGPLFPDFSRVSLSSLRLHPLVVFSSAYISEESSRARWIFVGVKANKGHESSTPIWFQEQFRSWRSMFVKSAPPSTICICMHKKKLLYRPQSCEREIGCRCRDSKNICMLPKIDSYGPNVITIASDISSVVQYLRLCQSLYLHCFIIDHRAEIKFELLIMRKYLSTFNYNFDL